MKRYEGRYCTFAVPDDWVAKPPFAFVGEDDAGGQWTAQTLERCMLEALPASGHLKQQKEILPDLYEGFQLLSDTPYSPVGSGEGFTLTFRFLDEDENDSLAQAFHIVLGPLACQLVLAGPVRPDRVRDRLFAAIAKTFQFLKVEFLTKAQQAPLPLTSEIVRTPQPVAAKGWLGAWRKFPRSCISLPVPSGWEVTEDEGDALFLRGSAEIRLHRDLEGHGAPGHWFAHRMRQLQESGGLLLGSESGEMDRGSYAAVLYQERGLSRTWRTAAVTRSLDLFLSGQQSLIWTLKAPEAGFPDQRSLFESLIVAAEFLVPAEWETKLVEPWVDYTLRGPWQAEGPGLYVNVEHAPAMAHFSREPYNLSIKNIQPSIVESLRRGVGPVEGVLEHTIEGIWKSHEAFSYSLDGTALSRNSTVSIRATWLLGRGSLYGLFVRGVLREEVDHLARALLDGFIGDDSHKGSY